MYASDNGMQSIVETMIANGADLTIKDFAQKTGKKTDKSTLGTPYFFFNCFSRLATVIGHKS